MKTLSILLGLLTACAMEQEQPAQETFTLTVVEVGPDGVKEISRTPIGEGEREALVPPLQAAGARLSGGPAGAEMETLDSSCGATALFLYDAVNYGGNVICVNGTGYVHLSQFIHHWTLEPDVLGTTHLVPVGWQGLAGSAWAGFISADFYQDGNAQPIRSLGPVSGTNFVTYNQQYHFLFRYPPDSVILH